MNGSALDLTHGAALAYLEREWGGHVQAVEAAIATAAAAARITGNNPECISINFVNLGLNPIFIGLNSAVSASRGIYLASSGGSASMSVRDDGDLPTREWYAISPAGASTLYVLRLSRYGQG